VGFNILSGTGLLAVGMLYINILQGIVFEILSVWSIARLLTHREQ